MNSSQESGRTKPVRFYQARNESTRIDVFEELSHTALAALRSFGRRLGAPHLIDEVVLPTLEEGDARVFTAVRDRPWPPWGVGARHVSALCLVQAIADESYSVSAVYVTDEDLTNVGLIAGLYKEVLESLAVSERSEVNYLAAEGSVLASHVLTSLGFRRYDDVMLTEEARYFTYRLPARELLKRLGLEGVATPDLLAQEVPAEVLERNALFHQTIYLGSKAELAVAGRPGEIIRPPRGGHAGKPGGVPGGTGRFGWVVLPEEPVFFFVTLENFLGDLRLQLLEHVKARQADFRPATVLLPGQTQPAVNEKLRRSKTLDKLGDLEGRIADRVKESLQPVLARLGRKAFPLGRIEMQITASGDGDYFRMHRDTGEKDTRELAFAYFFHREPRHFSGGELRIFDAETIGGKVVPTDRSQLLSPRQDVIVFFPAENEHEVLPVRVASRDFADSRFTVNGWIHRAR